MNKEFVMGHIAVMQVKGDILIIGLPVSEDIECIIDHVQEMYPAVVVDIKDMWIN
ncbi:MAG: hypothetical protein SFH39_07165 [Candidatus Magnetobacterium sp. LHC-1]|nr:hypothetical protein [Nitrospirota bacterium]